MQIIKEQNELEEFCNKIKSKEFITVDTEFLREHTYYPKLCLIQIACNDCEAIIDPISHLKLQPLFDIFNDPKVIKVFHSARQDIEIILNLSGNIPQSICDTQVMAMVCGLGTAISYAKLVENIKNIKIDKSLQFTDWSRRPLSVKQLEYALSDVTHLRDVYLFLDKQINELNRANWLNDEMQTLKSRSTYITDKENLWKKLNPKSHSRRFLGIVKELVKWRETAAQSQNVPRNRVLRDSIILEIASSEPKTFEELGSLRVAGKAVNRNSEIILQTIKKVSQMQVDDLPELIFKPKKKEEDVALTEMIKLLLKVICEEQQVASKIIADSKNVQKLALYKDQPELKQLPAMQNWRYDIFGKYVEMLIKGQIALIYKNGKAEILEID